MSTPCDDGLYCNGADTCDGNFACVHAGDPCSGEALCQDLCDEDADACTEQPDQTSCGNGLRHCSGGACCPGWTTPGDGGCDLNAPEHNIVFSTSSTFAADFGSLENADAECNALAAAAGLAGTYRAWLSTSSEDARDRVSDGPYYLVNEQRVAEDLADLTDGRLGVAIALTENGTSTQGLKWTGTATDGTLLANNCADWTSADAGDESAMGVGSQSDYEWTTVGFTRTCDIANGLYCFQDDCPGQADVDFQTDRDNCGSCGHVCESGSCISGSCKPLVFVTRWGFDVTELGDLAGADAVCKMVADAVPSLNGRTWTAWLSDDSTDAIDRVTDQPYFLVDGTQVVDGSADLAANNLQHAIDLDEAGMAFEFSTYVWTGTHADGTVVTDAHCSGWGSTTGVGQVGLTLTGSQWTNADTTLTCDDWAQLYCFEN